MQTRKYLHFVHSDKAEKLLEGWAINNRLVTPEERITGWWMDIAVQEWNFLKAVRGFVYDVEQIMQSRYTRNLPFVHERFIRKQKMGTSLRIFPRFVDVYKVEQFRALFFNVSKKVKRALFDSYMVDEESGERIYFETGSTVPIEMKDVIEVPTVQVCQEVFWMKPPFVTYKFAEGADGYEGRVLRTDAKTINVSSKYQHLVK